jgi:hypothetical protein
VPQIDAETASLPSLPPYRQGVVWGGELSARPPVRLTAREGGERGGRA